MDIDPHVPDSPASIVWSVCSITALATPMAFLILLRSATAPASIVSLTAEKTQKINIISGVLHTSDWRHTLRSRSHIIILFSMNKKWNESTMGNLGGKN